MTRGNDDIVQKAFGGCITLFIVFGGLAALFIIPAALIGHLLYNFTPSLGLLFADHGLLGSDPDWQKRYPHMILRFAAVDVGLILLTTLAVRSIKRRRA